MEACPDCNGEGEVETFEDRWQNAGHTTIDRVETCSTCSGTGEVDHDDLSDPDDLPSER